MATYFKGYWYALPSYQRLLRVQQATLVGIDRRWNDGVTKEVL